MHAGNLYCLDFGLGCAFGDGFVEELLHLASCLFG